jgi:hypothetical protein
MMPYVALEGEGEAYVNLSETLWHPWETQQTRASDRSLVVRLPQARDVIGMLFVPKEDWSGMVKVRFRIPADAAKPEAREAFYREKEHHYRQLVHRNLPGGAWFRHEARSAEEALGKKAKEETATTGNQPAAEEELQRTYELFSGGRAISENLQLDRQLLLRENKGGGVDIRSISGIQVREIDWKPRIKDLKPKLDPLAALIPADQHVVFFPSFPAAVKVADETGLYSLPILHLTDIRAEDAHTEDRYQRQLGLPMSTLARLLGPHVARSVALTGSDTYFPSGTDVAVLFEAPQPALLENLLVARVALAVAQEKDVKPLTGEVGGVKYRGFRSPDRRVCSYVARLDGAVVVTNSLVQLERLASVKQGKTAAIASLPEYTFFRNRYPLGDSAETALVFLSDATIRRWCSPRWRILNSRRTRDAAVLSELQATYLDALVKKTAKPGPIQSELPLTTGGELMLTERGVLSSTLGALEFMTPICELSIEKATAAEAEAYGRWRQAYEWNWNWAFDPIALRVSLKESQLGADLTVMPLILHSQYRDWMVYSQGGKFGPEAGDLHGAPLHFIVSLDPKSEEMQSLGRMFSSTAKGISLSWVGSSLAVYAEEDPFWKELAKQKDPQRLDFILREIDRVPLGVNVDVSSGMGLTLFLAGLRSLVEQTSPGMTQWDSLTYRDQPYVRIRPTERARNFGPGRGLDKLRIYYTASGKALVVTLREDLIQHAIDRQLDCSQEKPQSPKPVSQPWLGSNAGLQMDRRALEVIAALTSEDYQRSAQVRAWGNLPVLNEWKHHYPNEDPLAVHRRLWGMELVCPGGGRYVWNQEWQTMESTVYGHPGQPQPGPALPPEILKFQQANFGLSFEDQGLRAKLILKRETPSKAKKPAQPSISRN